MTRYRIIAGGVDQWQPHQPMSPDERLHRYGPLVPMEYKRGTIRGFLAIVVLVIAAVFLIAAISH